MGKSKSRGFREMRKPRPELPDVPDLGTLSMPRKSNRAAAKYVAMVGSLWGRRRADRKARKLALRRQDAQAANPRRHHLDKAVREQMLTAMPGWVFDHKTKMFVPMDDAPERLEELLDAVTDLQSQTIVLRVAGLSPAEAARVRGYLQTGSSLIAVNSRPRASISA
ncbi:hypothetical protein F6J84_11285 [Microbacterium caowuchunii]|uniref:hypothetical protein n=1 Tax=Microbacterium caowuchunii TaxID=2614638 RepID=UPI0012464CDE|nr:hypothetical protein [Microbacterium caowuchunii]QEW00621.1 hypothetical protein F6J84_11285 [Microbacterium caowuchunii]